MAALGEDATVENVATSEEADPEVDEALAIVRPDFEVTVLSAPAELVRQMWTVPGRIDVTTTTLYFVSDPDTADKGLYPSPSRVFLSLGCAVFLLKKPCRSNAFCPMETCAP